MSCDAAALALTLHLAALRPVEGSVTLVRIATAPPPPLAREPLFSAIVETARQLKDDVQRRRGVKGAAGPIEGIEAQATALAALDMQGHLELARRGTDGDLKCILRGLSQDIPRRLDELKSASGEAARRRALDELFYLLRDNVEVITTPAAVTSTDVAG